MKQNTVPASVWRDPMHFIAFGFGSGAMPYAPGTFGTLMAIPFYLILRNLPLVLYIVTVVIITILAIRLCSVVSKEIYVDDHPGMVIDEFVGFFITMIAAPPGWSWIILGFILFRIFDIWKPQPIRWLDQHVIGGFGVIVDDIVAGIFAFIVMQLLRLLI